MTDLYAVIGNPIAQSKSPFIHARFAEALGQDMTYVAIEAPREGFAARVNALRREGGRGLNVTTPFKLDAFAYATDCSVRARHAGAVNAIKFEGEQVMAENFDGVGLLADVEANLGFVVAGRRVLIAGAGGAARGAIEPLLAARPAALVVANRTPDKAKALAMQFASYGPVAGAGYSELERLPPFDLVVNATSASLRTEAPAIPAAAFASGSLAYEMVYGKGLTPFLQAAEAAGATHLADGVGMLVEQAAEAFAWWRGVRPDTKPVIAALATPLA
jgi:shikimate dehydrogenase